MAPFEMVLLVVLGDIIQQGRRARVVLEGVPIVLVADGKPIDAALAVEHMPLDEVLEAARQQGVDDLAKVRLAVLEVSGKISIIT